MLNLVAYSCINLVHTPAGLRMGLRANSECVLWPLENQIFSINVLFAVARTTTTRTSTSKFNSSFMDGLLVYRQSSQNVFCVFRSLYIHYT